MRSFASSFRRAAGPVLLLAAITSALLWRQRDPDSPPPVAPLALKAGSPGKSPPLWEALKSKALERGVAAPVPRRITVFPDVSAWTEGESVRLPLGDGQSVEGRVNLVRMEGGVLHVAGGITSGPEAGGFSFGLENGRLQGSAIFRNVDRAVLYAGDAAVTEALETTASELMCRNYPVPPEVARSDRGASAPDGPMAAPIQLSSRPGAAAVLYLDFDGATVTDPDWNLGATIFASASGLTDTQVSTVWRRVREDFIPFNVDVTTIESRYTNAAVANRMRCIITRSDAWYNENDPFGAGGVAYRNSFNLGGTTLFSATIPCWAFSNLFNDPQDLAEVVSHELGHTLGLAHDGTAAEEYYLGHGFGSTSWAPIMGAGYNRSVVQWSRGEYSGANNREDDVATIANDVNGFGFVPDEAGGTPQTAAVLPVVNTVVNHGGVITSSGDVDLYQFQSSGGNVSITISPGFESPNLDVAATLENAAGTVLSTANPNGVEPAVITARLTTSGTFYLRLAGSGFGSASTGYTSYGSIGGYNITGTVPTAPPEIVVEAPSVGGIESGAGASIGDVVSGGSRSLTFTIRNSGVGNLIALAVTKSGANAADFTVSEPAVQTLDPGVTTQFTVTFAPRETGAKSAILHIASNDPDENPFEIPLTANGTPAAPPDIIVANASGQSLSDGAEPLVMGNSLVGTAIRRAFTIRNDGLAPLTGITVTKDGANPGDFTITQPVMTVLNFGQRTTFEVSFNPPALGMRTVALHVQSNDPDEAPFDISLAAAGVSSGATDSGMNALLAGKVYATAEQPDGKIIVGGDFTSIGGGQRTNIARLNPDGSLDETFVCATNDFVYCLAVQPDGKILLGGQFYAVNEIPRNRLARVNADGSLDTAFNPDAGGYVYSLGLLPDGKIMAGGAFYQIGGQGRANVARLNPDGTADPGFSGGVNDYVYCLAVQDDGKVVIGGGFTMHGTVTRNHVARLTAAGALDTGFNPNANGPVLAVAIQPDGKVLIGGGFTTLGSTARNRIARLTAAGVPDTAFKPDFNDNVYSIAMQADGKILAGGWFTAAGSTAVQRLARLNTDGVLDPGFNASVDTHVFSLAVLTDGSVLAGGFFQNAGGLPRTGLARLLNGPPNSALTVPSASTVQWLRGGTAPEVTSVTFETSPDGEVWTKLGNAARMTGGWRLTGQSLNGLGRMRARARTAGGLASGSGGLIEEIVSYGTAPEITVEQPAGSSLADNVSMVDFGLTAASAPLTRQFTIWNYGTAPLTGLSRSVTGTHAADFTATALPAASIAPGENMVFTVTFLPGGAGVREAELRIASNDADENPFRLRLAGAVETPYLSWKVREFGTAANTGPSADTADGDGDGFHNLMEFSLGIPPDEPTETPVRADLDGAFLRFTYPRAVEAQSDILFTVEWSDQPDSAAWSTEGVTEAVAGETSGVQTMVASVPAGNAGRRFVRLRVTGK